MLTVDNLQAYYGKSHVLHGVDLTVGQGEIVSLLGRNGVGRSTTAKAIMGLVDCTGRVVFKGRDITGLPTYRIAHAGLGYVPESRDIFPALTVAENLTLGLKGRRPGRWSFDDMYALFPRLRERERTLAGVLSGGEQQMLTLARTMMGDPDLVIIDEPTEGLAP
jgi:branched-chain amino acid transport system ATP-binding protein